MTDLLSLWKEVGWGYAMWNLRGPFGVLDSGREDVEYEDYKGHKLDRKMLELMKEY
jgi:endoglucanase